MEWVSVLLLFFCDVRVVVSWARVARRFVLAAHNLQLKTMPQSGGVNKFP